MKILGIETSCDETAAAIVENGVNILSNIVSTSQGIHVGSGGIIPEVAAREQIKYLLPVVKKAIESCQLEVEDLDAIAITTGPGLIGSLLLGTETAKALAYLFRKPIIPVNHLTAHLYANWLNITSGPSFPAITLIASGGHTDLLLMKNHNQLQWLGGTRDDAAGEAFDKIARTLGLPYPGGPAIAAEAAKFKVKSAKLKVRLPRPILEEDNFDFSFSGLKTAALREVNKLKTTKQFNNEAVKQVSFEAQEAIADVLVKKTLRAARKYQVKSILLGGGVTANKRLREKFRSKLLDDYQLCIPPSGLCTDNAATIASAAFFNYKPLPWEKVSANPELHF